MNLKALEVALGMGAKIRFCRRCGGTDNPLFPVLPYHVPYIPPWPYASSDEKFATRHYWCSVCISDHNGELDGWDFMYPLAPQAP